MKMITLRAPHPAAAVPAAAVVHVLSVNNHKIYSFILHIELF
jgi:hypothetical protein